MNDLKPAELLRNFGKTTFKVLAFPVEFFGNLSQDRNWQGPAAYLLICVLVHVIMIWLLASPGFAIRSLVMGLIFPFVTAALLYLILTGPIKASGTYLGAFKVTAYASAVNLFSWMSGVGLLMEFYRIYIMTKGLEVVFGIRSFKAFGAIAGTMMTYIILSVLLNTVSEGKFLELLK